MIVGHLVSILRALYPDDEKISTQCDWMESWLATMPELEVFQRMIEELDTILEKPVPEFNFLPDGIVQKARKKAQEKSP